MLDTARNRAGQTVSRTFKATKPDRSVYYDNLNAPVKPVMGLPRAMIVDARAPLAGQKLPLHRSTPAVQKLFDDLARRRGGRRHGKREPRDDDRTLRSTSGCCPQAPNLFAEVGSCRGRSTTRRVYGCFLRYPFSRPEQRFPILHDHGQSGIFPTTPRHLSMNAWRDLRRPHMSRL